MSALNQIFVRVHFRYDRDRYAEDLEQFAAWLLANEYPNKSARGHLYRVQQVLHALGTEPSAPLKAHELRWVFRRKERRQPRYRHTHTTYSKYLRSVHRLEEPRPPEPSETAIFVDEFCARLARRRGLATSTIYGYRLWISDFLRRSLPANAAVADLKQGALPLYIQSRARDLTWTTLQNAIKCVQAFLRDCHERGLIPERIDQIDLPRRFRAGLPPRAMPWPYVEQLLASVDRTRQVGIRDHAILHLMAHYGLRTGEITDLRLDSIDWRTRTLTVWRAKTRSTTVLPLHERTIAVLKRYLETGRPRSDLPYLFLTATAPRGPLTKYSTSFLFLSRLRRSGLPNSRYTAYSLRHAFAMRLFQNGVGMKAIGDLMGHSSLVSTSVYLRLQADQLREVALPVPQPHGENVA